MHVTIILTNISLVIMTDVQAANGSLINLQEHATHIATALVLSVTAIAAHWVHLCSKCTH